MKKGRRRSTSNLVKRNFDAKVTTVTRKRIDFETIEDYIEFYTRNYGKQSIAVRWLEGQAKEYSNGIKTKIEQAEGTMHAILKGMILREQGAGAK